MLYFSVHRYEKALFFPSSPDAAADAVGTGSGKGTTVNVGWNTNGFKRPGDGEYRAVWEEILLPIGRAYEPDLVIVATVFFGRVLCDITITVIILLRGLDQNIESCQSGVKKYILLIRVL